MSRIPLSFIFRLAIRVQQTPLYEQYEDFDFTIVHLPHLSNNILSLPADGIYISQPIVLFSSLLTL